MPQIRLYKHIVDTFRLQKNLEYTVPEIKKNISKYGVLVDNQLVKNQLEWVYPEQKIEPNNWPVRQRGDISKIRIIYEDDETLVLFKPYGLVVEPGAGHRFDNLSSWLIGNYPKQDFRKLYANNAEEIPLTGLVHRLDKDSQGLLLVAKDLESFHFLQNQFRSREVVKKYLAVVEGCVDKVIHVHNWQSRDKMNPVRQKFFWTQSEAINFDPEARNASSIIQPILYCSDKDKSLIQIQIKTGRMHQIRLQCENLGFPLVGDKVYNRKIEFDNTTFSSNSENHMFYSLNQEVQEVGNQEFETEKARIFGGTNYCLLANELEIMLPNQKLAKFVLNEIPKPDTSTSPKNDLNKWISTDMTDEELNQINKALK
jgi:23S rRNA pseudouridine1911/1915/1917 synthase